MNNLVTARTSLVPYDADQGDLESIRVDVVLRDASLRVQFVAAGKIEGLKVPARVATRRTDRLWEHTCFEVFLKQDESAKYYEFNLSPSREWAAYGFSTYRVGTPFDYRPAPELIVQQSASTLELVATIDLQPMLLQPGKLLRLGLSAVIESADGGISYWAVQHPAARPDFHHPDSFAVALSFPGDPSGKRLQ